MKNTLLIFVLMVWSLISLSQIINIPDANFKNALVKGYSSDNNGDGLGDGYVDKNKDGEIDTFEANQVIGLDISGERIDSIDGIEFFSNLKYLNCNENYIKNLNLFILPNLERLECGLNRIIELDLRANQKLVYFEYNDNGTFHYLKNLKLKNNHNLKNLRLSESSVKSIDFNECPNIEKLSLYENDFPSLDITMLSKLMELHFSNSDSLKLINLGKLENLTYCYISGFKNLKYIDLSGLSNLSNLFLRGCGLQDLNIDNNREIITLWCDDNSIKYLNISNNSKLKNLLCKNNLLEYLILKNGVQYISLNFSNNPALKYICCDASMLDYVKNLLVEHNIKNAEVNSYCSFTPGGKFFSLIGKNKYDFNSNGCDDQDLFYPNFKYNISNATNSGFIISNLDGSYFIPVQEGTHKIKPILENRNYYNLSPDSITVTFPSTSDTIIQDFCITPKGIYKQLDLSITPLSPPARPGFDASFKVVMTNKGNQEENGTLYFAYDESKMDFVSTDVNPSTQSNGLLSWNFTDLLPFETRYYNVTLNINSPSDTPPVNAGDELLITCNILDNVFLLKQEVVGSYDPNDKTCLEGKTITPEQVGEYVHYLIRFENTGNYAAENVVVKDVIDESTFDISTLQITDASHEAWARINGNIVEFIFENIQLPFDDATNDGYICFKIKTKPTLVLGNELKNEANIYFDYNLPILTNKTNTVVANLVGTDEAIGESDIEIFPNPVSDVLKFSGDDKILKVEIFDMSGRLVQVSRVVNSEVSVGRLLSGAYQLKVYTQLGVRNSKMVKI